MADVNLTVGALFKDALKSVDKFAKRTTKTLDKIQKSFSSLKFLAAGAVAFLAGRQLIRGFKAVTEAAAQQELAVQKLNTALRLSGDFSEEASKDIQQFAKDLQASSTVGDEVAISQVALAKTFGATNDQAKRLVQAAADLSAIQGIELEAATRQIAKTFGGFGGELSEINPLIKELTQEELKAGAAIDVLAKQFDGAAEALTKTFSGATDQAANTFGDFQEVIGSFITENPLVIAAINAFSEGITKLGDFLEKNKGSITDFVTEGLAKILDVLPIIIRGFGAFFKVVGAIATIFIRVSQTIRNAIISVLEFALSFKFVQAIVNLVADNIKAFVGVTLKSLAFLIDKLKLIPGLSDDFKDFGIDIDDVTKSLDDMGDSAIDALGQDVTENLKDALVTVKEGADGASEALINGFKITNEAIDSSADAVDGLGDKVRKLGKTKVDLPVTLDVKDPKKLIDFSKVFEGFGPKLISSITKGAEGARSAFVGVATKLAEAFFPGFGGAIGEVIGLLSQGPEKVRETLTAFIDEIPTIIENVIKSIPVVLEVLAEKLPELLTTAFEKAIPALVAAAPKVIAAMVEQAFLLPVAMAESAFLVIRELVRNSPQIVKSIALGVRDEFKGLGKQFAEEFKDSIQSGGGLGGGGGGGFLGTGIGGGGGSTGLGFQHGGVVPGGFPNDTFQAALTSGEEVATKAQAGSIERSTAVLERIASQLGGGGQGQDLSVSIGLGEEELANVQLNLDRNGFRTA